MEAEKRFPQTLPVKISAVLKQSSELDFLMNVAIKREVTWSVHPFAGNPFAAEQSRHRHRCEPGR